MSLSLYLHPSGFLISVGNITFVYRLHITCCQSLCKGSQGPEWTSADGIFVPNRDMKSTLSQLAAGRKKGIPRFRYTSSCQQKTSFLLAKRKLPFLSKYYLIFYQFIALWKMFH